MLSSSQLCGERLSSSSTPPNHGLLVCWVGRVMWKRRTGQPLLTYFPDALFEVFYDTETCIVGGFEVRSTARFVLEKERFQGFQISL